MVAEPLLKESEASLQLSDCRKEAANCLRLMHKLPALDAQPFTLDTNILTLDADINALGCRVYISPSKMHISAFKMCILPFKMYISAFKINVCGHEKLISASKIIFSASNTLIYAFKMSIFVSCERVLRPKRGLQRPTRTVIASRKRLPAFSWTQIVFKKSLWCPIRTDLASSKRSLRRFNQLSDPFILNELPRASGARS